MLKVEMVKHGLSVNGNKSDLAARLAAHYRERHRLDDVVLDFGNMPDFGPAHLLSLPSLDYDSNHNHSV